MKLLYLLAALIIFTFFIRGDSAEQPEASAADMPGRVYLDNGNLFDGSIDICRRGNVSIYMEGGRLDFPPARVREIRLNNGVRIDINAVIALEKHYSADVAPEARYDPIIIRYCRVYGVDEELVRAVIRQESGFNYMAVSHKGASGLMQLMPATAARYNVNNIFDPVENIGAGVRHLSYLLQKYNGNKKLALAAYNAGTGAVKRYNGIPPFRETTHYVRAVYRDYRRRKGWEL